MPLNLPPIVWGEATFLFMTTVLTIFVTLLVAEAGYYLSLLIRREKRDQREYEEVKLAHVSENLPPSSWQ